MLDILFCSIPYSNLDQIYSAPAILKGVVTEHGYTAKTVDFGCELLKLCNGDPDRFYQVQNYFISPDTTHRDTIEEFYTLIIDYLKKNPAKYIGLSVFSIWTHKATVDILERIKQAGIDSKIIAGGCGLFVPAYSVVHKDINIRARETILKFGDLLKQRGLIDYPVYGDGEDPVLAILNNTEYTKDLDADTFKSSVPDYSDYNFNDYLFNGTEVQLPITGSKGCVRKCDFCDVEYQFGRFRYRSGADVANEMIANSQKYGIYKFQFTDSLVNGGLKPFEEFLIVLSNYNLANPDKRIKWNGQYICRPASQMPARLYQLMAAAGAEGLTIGAESGSNHVLVAMNKKTTVEALYTELEQFRQHGITCLLLTFVGHWSETWEDFEQHCRMMIDILPYVRSGTISAVKLGDVFLMIDGTPVAVNAKENQIDISEFNKEHVWIAKTNPTNTLKERVYRRLILGQLVEKLNIPTINDAETMLYINSTIEQQHEQINEFYDQYF